MSTTNPTLFLLAGLLLLTACAAPAPPSGDKTRAYAADPDGAPPAPMKRLVAAIQSDPGILNDWVNPPGSGVPGLDVLQTMVGSGLSIPDDQGALRPLLTDTVPSLDNGLWKLLPGGRMETTWRIRQGSKWHDGTPFTSADLEFTARVQMDKIVDVRTLPGFDSVDAISAPDPTTITVTWKRPFIYADALWNSPPLPKHLLEETYIQDKVAFGALSYWTHEFVGNGPFKVRQYVAGSHVILEANDSYVLGRPKLDEVEVRFIPDPSALASNLLAGAVEITLGRSLSVDQAVQVRDQWRDGRLDVGLSGWIVVFPQFIDPSPTVVTTLQFRRALMHAVDRQQMADTLMNGLVPVAHTFISPESDLHRTVASEIIKYDYNPRHAAAMIQELGYTKGPDGMFRDALDRTLNVEIRASAGRDINQKSILAIADSWQQSGVAADPQVIPQQRARDREYVQTFPGFILYNQPTDLNSLLRHRSVETPLPSNNYVGNNNSRYVNAEFDALIDRFFSTIQPRERTEALGRVIHHMTENLNMMPMFYNAEIGLVSHRLISATGRRGENASQTWNILDWDVKS